MKKNNTPKNILLKLLSFVPSLALLFLIFGFSAQDGESSGSLSFRISLFLVELFAPILPATLSNELLYERAEFIHLFVRKAAHMTEYFLLALSLQLPLFSCFSHRIGFRTRLGTGFLLTVCFAALDEYHQTFVPGRSGNLTDIGIDSIGAITASLLLYLVFSLREKQKTT